VERWQRAPTSPSRACAVLRVAQRSTCGAVP
jgi:hypothetical protein